MRTGRPSGSKLLIARQPERPAWMDSPNAARPWPIGVISPRPVTTTRRVSDIPGSPPLSAVPIPVDQGVLALRLAAQVVLAQAEPADDRLEHLEVEGAVVEDAQFPDRLDAPLAV